MKRRRRQSSGAAQMFVQMTVWVVFFWIVVPSITLIMTLRFSLSTLQGQIEQTLTSTATSLAGSDMVRQSLLQGYCTQETIEYLDLLTEMNDALDVLSIADADSTRVYHVMHDRIGGKFVGDDEGRALEGEAYFSDATGTMGPQHRYLAPVKDGNRVIGFVLASTTMDQMDVLRGEILYMYAKLTVALLLLTFVICALLTVAIRRVLHGYDANELVHNYLMQNELLGNLDEGIISVDAQGKVQLVNRAAEQMLGQQADMLIGRSLDTLIVEKSGGSLLAGPRKDVATSHASILASSIPLYASDSRMGIASARRAAGNPAEDGGADAVRKGTTLILTDRTEAMRVAEQLNGTRHVVSALRANTHEFMNKLHAIAGLIMMGRTDDALAYIGSIADMQAKAAAPILRHIENPSVAALLLGKLSNMREMDIEMTLLANSHLPKHSQYLSTDEMITVVGNLIENAIEALKGTSGKSNIVLQLTEDENGLLIMVTDTGCGIAPEDLPHIYEPGYSTKALEGRGMGMALVHEALDRHDGSVEVDTEPGEGTTFTLIFAKKREGL